MPFKGTCQENHGALCLPVRYKVQKRRAPFPPPKPALSTSLGGYSTSYSAPRTFRRPLASSHFRPDPLGFSWPCSIHYASFLILASSNHVCGIGVSDTIVQSFLIYLAWFLAMVFRALPFLNHSIWPALKVWASLRSNGLPSLGLTVRVTSLPGASSVHLMSTYELLVSSQFDHDECAPG